MEMFAGVLGGIGLFILGMSLLTDGIKSIAGDSLRKMLSRFTGGTFTSIASGTIITAVVQSSSATTVLTIGFVSAGLLTFSQSIGVILGANIGSTSTGWIVSLVGFKINMTLISLPVICFGVFLKLFSNQKLSSYGIALAGFGLIFVGIDFLQNGMGHLANSFNFELFSNESFLNLIILLLIGIAMTVVMQSSSAAVATTLTALYTGAIAFEQAAVLVIGQNVGTTVKAALATIGASTSAKRTALSHILFNLLTGLIALLMLPFLIKLSLSITHLLGFTDYAVAIAIFHTLFNVAGVLLIIPFMRSFTQLIVRLIPEKGNPLVHHLDSSVATVAPIAIEAARRSLIEIMIYMSETMSQFMQNNYNPSKIKERIEHVESAIRTMRQFLSKINTESTPSKPYYDRHVSLLHALDHIERLLKAIGEEGNLSILKKHHLLLEVSAGIMETLDQVSQYNRNPERLEVIVEFAEKQSKHLAEIRRVNRRDILQQTASNQYEIETAIQKVQSLLWLDRLCYHLWRALHHLQTNND